MKEQRNFDQKLSALLSSAFVAALISGLVSWWISKNEVSAKYIEMAVSVLSSHDTKDEKALREWSIKVINKYADCSLKIEGDVKNRLINGEANLAGFGTDKASGSGVVSEAHAPTGRASPNLQN